VLGSSEKQTLDPLSFLKLTVSDPKGKCKVQVHVVQYLYPAVKLLILTQHIPKEGKTNTGRNRGGGSSVLIFTKLHSGYDVTVVEC
jgi:hypothetical protein